MSMKALAASIKMGYAAVSGAVSGSRPLGRTMQANIAQVFGISVADLRNPDLLKRQGGDRTDVLQSGDDANKETPSAALAISILDELREYIARASDDPQEQARLAWMAYRATQLARVEPQSQPRPGTGTDADRTAPQPGRVHRGAGNDVRPA
jgi:hypothetical protein